MRKARRAQTQNLIRETIDIRIISPKGDEDIISGLISEGMKRGGYRLIKADSHPSRKSEDELLIYLQFIKNPPQA